MPITKQTVAIIGAGSNIGSIIATNIAGGNYRLLLFDQSPEKLPVLTEKILDRYPNADLKPMDCAHDCSWEADIIVMAVLTDQKKEIANKIRDVATQKIVVNITDAKSKSFRKVKNHELQQWLPHSRIVNVFNTNLETVFKQQGLGNEIDDLIISGDDQQAIEAATELLKTMTDNVT